MRGSWFRNMIAGENLLRSAKTIAVVGLSGTRWRPSYGVSEYMQSVGYRIIPVNPKETEVLGEAAYATLEDVPVPVDIVNIFRQPRYVPDIVDAAIRIGAKLHVSSNAVYGTEVELSVPGKVAFNDQPARKPRGKPHAEDRNGDNA